MSREASCGDFKIDDYQLLALAMMGIGHMLGQKFILWQKKSIDLPFFKKIVQYLSNGVDSL